MAFLGSTMPRFVRPYVRMARWLALHCVCEGCSGRPSRSSPQEDEPWGMIALRARPKTTVVCTAIAREVVGFMWWVAREAQTG